MADIWNKNALLNICLPARIEVIDEKDKFAISNISFFFIKNTGYDNIQSDLCGGLQMKYYHYRALHIFIQLIYKKKVGKTSPGFIRVCNEYIINHRTPFTLISTHPECFLKSESKRRPVRLRCSCS